MKNKKAMRQVDYLLMVRKKTCKGGSVINPAKGGKYKRDKKISYED